MKWIGTEYERSVRQSMMNYLPSFYADSPTVNEIIRVDADEMEAYYAAAQDVLNQFYIHTATWGLKRWERFLGLPERNETDPTSLEERRAAIRSKLQGFGTTNATKIIEIAALYTGGKVNVIEDYANYNVVVEFVSLGGIPSNIAVLESVLRTMIPAHLSINFKFRYLTWNEFDNANISWDVLEAKNLTWDELTSTIF